MASKNISSLTSAGALSGTEIVPLVKSGNTRRTTAQDIANLSASAALDSIDINGRILNLNDIYPVGVGPTAASLSPATQTPASLGYTDIADYIADLPTKYQAAATSYQHSLTTFIYTPMAPRLTDECDWIAMQTASNYIFDNWKPAGPYVPNNTYASGRVMFNGQYIVNRTTTWTGDGIELCGIGHGSRFGGARITWGGAYVAGTLDEPVYIFDCYVKTNFQHNYGGRYAPTSSAGAGLLIQRINFTGAGGDSGGIVGDESDYLSAINLRRMFRATVEDCLFDGCIYDGIVLAGQSIDVTFRRNFFYGVYRDALTVMPTPLEYTTTCYIYENYFGSVGRYCFNGGYFNAISPNTYFVGNIVEGAYDSYYQRNPEWFCQGVRAAMLFLGCNTTCHNNYLEGVIGPSTFDFYYHFCGASPAIIRDDWGGAAIFTTFAADGTQTLAAKAYSDDRKVVTGITTAANAVVTTSTAHGYSNGDIVHLLRQFANSGGFGVVTPHALYGPDLTVTVVNATQFTVGVNSSALGTFSGQAAVMKGHSYLDLTNTRNFHVNYQSSAASNIAIHIDTTAMPYIAFADDIILSDTDGSSFRNCNVSYWTLPTRPAVSHEGRVVTPIDEGVPSYETVPTGTKGVVLTNTKIGGRAYGNFSTRTSSGDYQTRGFAPTWAANTAYFAAFAENAYYSTRQLIQPTTTNWTGYMYQAVSFAGKIIGITNANPAAVTMSQPHNLTTGQTIAISGVIGMAALNYNRVPVLHANFTITVTGATTFTLGIDTTNTTVYVAYQKGGHIGGISGATEPIISAWPPATAVTGRIISGISPLSPAQVTSNGHGFANGQTVYIERVRGMIEVNNRVFTVAGVTTNTFQLSGVNATAYTAYVGGGLARPVTVDGSVIWRFGGPAFQTADNGRSEVMHFGKRIIAGTAAPATGLWAVGDQVIFNAPTAGGGAQPFVGLVCTSGGLAGTAVWKTFGPIST